MAAAGAHPGLISHPGATLCRKPGATDAPARGTATDLRQLRYFVAIIQCGSITRASLQLGIAQPALSLHIRNMEADLGRALLFRTPQGVQPTEAGAILLRNAQLILGQFEQALAELVRSGTWRSAQMRVST